MKQRLPLVIFCILSFYSIKAQLNLQWQEVGPDNFGGKVRALIYDKRDSTRQTLYAGVMGGGIWKTTDGGAWWYSLGCGYNYAVSCLAQASDGAIYFGTGDAILNSGPYILSSSFSQGHIGNGIYKIDSADNISHLFLTSLTGPAASPWQGVNRIAINPKDSSYCSAATITGLYISTNRGITWSEVAIPGIAQGQLATDVKWSGDGKIVYAAVNGGNTLVFSTDGFSWNVLTPATNPGFPPVEGRIEIAIAPSNSDVVYISVAMGGTVTNGATYGVFKTDSARSPSSIWSTVATRSASFDPFSGLNEGWAFNAITVCPVDSSKIYVGGVNMYAYSPQTGMTVLPSFINAVDTPSDYTPQFLYVINDLNPDEMYIASEFGVFKSTDIYSNTTPTISAVNYGLKARGFISVAATRNGNVLGVTDNDEGVVMNQGGSQSFRQIDAGQGFCEASQLDTNYYFDERFFGQLRSCSNNNFSFSSCLDNNIDPQQIGFPSRCSPINANDAPTYAPFLLHETKTAFNTNDSVTYVAGTSLSAGNTVSVTSAVASTLFNYTLPVNLNAGDLLKVPDPVKSRLFFSTNCGIWIKLHALSNSINPDWYKISDTIEGTVQCFAVTADGNTVYAGTSSGWVYRITGLNTTNYNNWNMGGIMSISASLADGNIQGIAVDPRNDSIVLCTNTAVTPWGFLGNGYKSTDAGATWSVNEVGPIGLPAYTCVIDAHNSNTYLVGTEQGVYTSQDSGATWQQDFGAMCDVPVYRLRQIPLLDDNCGVLYAATNSRGLWRSFTLTPAGCNTAVGINDNYGITQNGNFKIYPNPATSRTTIQFELPVAAEVELNMFDITGRKIQAAKQFLAAGNNKLDLNIPGLSPGTYLVSLMVGPSVKTKLLVVAE